MALANVSLQDSFDLWRTRTNQIVSWLNALDAANVISFVSNTGALQVEGTSTKYGTTYLTIVPSTNTDDVSTSNVAAASLANTIYQYTIGVSTVANNAYTQANSAYVHANNAYNSSNSVLVTAQAAYAAANSATSDGSLTTAQSAYTQANLAYVHANNAYNSSNTTTASLNITVGSAYSKANTLATTSSNGIIELATATELRVGTDPNRVPSISELWNSGATVALSDAATINVNFSLGYNFTVTLGGNRTLGNPTNVSKLQSGFIKVTQPTGAAANTLSYASNWDFAGGTAPTLSTAAGSVDVLVYQVLTSTSILVSLSKNVS